MLPLTIERFRAKQIAEAVIKVSMGYWLEVEAILEGKLHNISVATLPCAYEFTYFIRQCWWGRGTPASLLSSSQ